jgi:hypothetical protein
VTACVSIVAATGLGFVLTGGVVLRASDTRLHGTSAVRWSGRKLRRTSPVDAESHGLPTVSTTQLCRERRESFEALDRQPPPPEELDALIAGNVRAVHARLRLREEDLADDMGWSPRRNSV